MATELPDIRITDPHVKSIVEKHTARRNASGGTGTPTKTAGQMLLEYDAILEARAAAAAQVLGTRQSNGFRKPATTPA